MFSCFWELHSVLTIFYFPDVSDEKAVSASIIHSAFKYATPKSSTSLKVWLMFGERP
jgi:hypothetical protein